MTNATKVLATIENIKEVNATFAYPLPTLKNGELAKTRWVGMAVELLTTGKCRPVISTGFTRGNLYDETANVTLFLLRNGLKFYVGNDAPRGGKTGKYISLV